MSLPNREIYCPNCDIKCKRVQLEANMPGKLVELDQCYWCGGIWADSLEMQKVSHHEAKKIDKVDMSLLLNANLPVKREIFCPRGGSLLVPLSDPTFPRNLHVDVCLYCGGVWMNRGVLSKYKDEVLKKQSKMKEAEQKKRQEAMEIEDFAKKAKMMKGISSLGVMPGIAKIVTAGPVYETKAGAQDERHLSERPPVRPAEHHQPDEKISGLPQEALDLIKSVPESRKAEVLKLFEEHYSTAEKPHRKGVHIVYDTMDVLKTIVKFLGGKKKK